MPKASTTNSVPALSELDLKKRKNADAQAAFRARRNNYIATLESTVTTLESVVVQLQASCRDSNAVTEEVKTEYHRLKLEYREREHFWRALFMAKKSVSSDGDDLPPLPESLVSSGPQFSSYPPPPSYTPQSYSTYSPVHSPTIPYPEQEASSSGSNPSVRNGVRYQPYNYPSTNGGNDGTWSPSVSHPPSPTHTTSQPPSPTHTEAQSPSTAMNYSYPPIMPSVEMSPAAGRYATGQRPSLHSIDAPYSFSDNRSISPSLSSSGHSTNGSSSPAVYGMSSYESGLPTSHDRTDFDFPQPRTEPRALAFHVGGIGNLSSISNRTGPGADLLRQRLAMKREPSDQPLLPPLQTNHESFSSNGANDPDAGSSSPDFHSSFPDACPSDMPQISDTVAVIKASSFGGLRRARSRKKQSDVAAKAAHDVLEARGLNLGSFRGPADPQTYDELKANTL